jgi:multidrug efflux system outer membrane protein
MEKKIRNVIISFLLIVSLLGCMVGPNYRRPSIETPSSWRFEEKEAREVANTKWWEQFGDPVLNELIETALKENKDVKIAAANIEDFMGRYVTTQAPLFPQLGASVSGGRTRATELAAAPLSKGTVNPGNSFQIFLNANWEIDLWGKLRRATQAARADLLSAEEARRAVILTLATSVASTYVNLRDLDLQLEIAKQTAKSREGTYNLFKMRFGRGMISELELSQVRSEYEQALSTIPFIEKTIAQQENALSVLLGRNPGPIPRGKTIDDLVLPAVPAGLPSDLLRNRPDIRQAEQDLIAANARIGAATSLYFPAISLTGSYGNASADLSKLFTAPARVWSFAVPLTAPIFTAGAISGQVKSSKAVQQEALVRYERSIQTGFREVEDALIDQKKSREQLEIETQEVATLHSYARVARLRFDSGYTSYIEVLDAERSLFNAELSRAETKGILFQALVNLYKAMGGGWVVEADHMTDRTTDSNPSTDGFTAFQE